MKHLAQRLFVVSVVLLGAYLSSQFRQPDRPTPIVNASHETARETAESESVVAESAAEKPAPRRDFVARNVTLRDLNGRKVFQGDIDLSATIDRIDAGHKLQFPNDGSVFQNREGRLPKRNSGYYREWVHATPNLAGPGPQRVVTGKDGEAWYTSDHYRTFRQIR